MSDDTMRACPSCGEAKPVSEFFPEASRRGSACRECDRMRRREYMRRRRQDPSFLAGEREAARRFRAESPDRARGARRRYESRQGVVDRSSEIPDFDFTEPITYKAAHRRLTRWRGRASIHHCACGNRATSWAYRHGADYELSSVVENSRGGIYEAPYSPNPMDYDAMCQSCHSRYDKAAKRSRRT